LRIGDVLSRGPVTIEFRDDIGHVEGRLGRLSSCKAKTMKFGPMILESLALERPASFKKSGAERFSFGSSGFRPAELGKDPAPGGRGQ
jgi:hypothetical protein